MLSTVKLISFVAVTVTIVPFALSYHVSGTWSSSDAMTVVAKFAFQRTDSMQSKETRGYVYGNVTWNVANAAGPPPSRALLVLVNFEHFHRIYTHRHLINNAATFCPVSLKAASEVAFDSRCSPNGKQDFFRRVPCPSGELCEEEDDPGNVVQGYQLTYQVEDKAQARFWFLLLMNCRLDRACNWTSGSINDRGNTTAPISINYDLWLVNGDPRMKHYNPFEHQFSFDKMDTLEIFFITLFLNLILIGIQWRAYNRQRSRRGKFLFAILCVRCVQIACILIDVCTFAANGRGARAFGVVGEVLDLMADFMLMFLLVCIAKGWTINKVYVPDRNKLVLVSVIYFLLSIAFFVWTKHAVDDILDIDVFQTWPGWGLLLLRIISMVWFLVELRISMRAEYDDAKVSFLLHFGAGFLVWFIYLPVLGALSSQVAIMWRYKVIVSIAYLADFVACAVLINLFWPNSSNRNYFINAAATEELDDYEKAIIMEDLDGITEANDSRTSPMNGQMARGQSVSCRE